jgi:hypothetical protein
MGEIDRALNRVARGADNQPTSRLTTEPSKTDSPSPTLPGRTRRTRRSSSKVTESRHDVGDENAPNDRFSEANFQNRFRQAKTLMAKLSGTFAKSVLHQEPDSTMKRLYTRANSLAGFQCPPTRTVGFVGDSGVGKSSLLNSLLDKYGLARTSNSGSACTCVVTEYHYHESNDYKVEIIYFTVEEVLEQVQDLLRAYRHYHLHKDQFSSDEAATKEDFEKKAKVAVDTFRSMFGRRFSNEGILLDSSEENALSFLENLVIECLPVNRGRTEVRNSLDGCSELIGKLTSESFEQASDHAPAVWPYIQNIRVYTNAHILSKGLVLVDLPGLHDANSARRHITERYIIKCDEIFAICNEGRAITDAGVVSVLDLASKARLSNVGIICTKSDVSTSTT